MEPLNETKELKTPSGVHTITVKAYLTGVDRRAYRRTILTIASEEKGKTVDGVEEAENAMITQLVLAVDGSKEDIINQVLNMRADDYDFVIQTVNEIVEGMSKKKESTSDGNTSLSSEGAK